MVIAANTIRAARAGKRIATSAVKLAGRKANKEIKDEAKEILKSGAKGFEEGFIQGYNKENIPQNSPNNIVNSAINQHINNVKTGKNFLDNNDLTQNLSEQTKEMAGHAMSASALLFQGKHHEVAENIGKSQGSQAGALAASAVQQGKIETEKAKQYAIETAEKGAVKAKQSVADFMKQTHNAANTAYNTPVMSSARKTLGKIR